MKQIFILFIFLLFFKTNYSQIVIPVPTGFIGKQIVPEHGFLPGKKFPIYATIDKYDFQGFKLRVELYDDREVLKIKKINCSGLNIENTSELANPMTIFKVKQYVDSIFHQTGLVIDSTSTNMILIRLEAIDARLLGFGSIKVHGLCQIRVKFKDLNKVYCADIVDGDKHSPFKSNDFATRKTATRSMASASIRECIEQFLIDLKTIK